MIVIGVDPGADGAYSVFRGNDLIQLSAFPRVDGKVNFTHIYEDWKEIIEHEPCTFYMEKVGPSVKWSRKSIWSFAQNFGTLMGLITCINRAWVLVPPREWQKKILVGVDVKLTTKERSVEGAKRLFPGIDLRRSEAATKSHDGKSDALLIGLYGVRSIHGVR